MNDLFLRAVRREPVERTPVWLMRQAGRYLPGYRKLKEQVDFVTLCRTPELAVLATLEPIERFRMDAAILFADILTPLLGNGIEIEFAPGPVVKRPVRDRKDLPRLKDFVPGEAVPETLTTIELLVRELEVPLIGFCGAPFTLACYLVDGRGTKEFATTRAMMFKDPDLLREILDSLATMCADYVAAQVDAGVRAVQVFDTWAGLLTPEQFREFEAPAIARIFDRLAEKGVPSIYYVNGGGHLLAEMASSGAEVAGIDWRTPLDEVRRKLPESMAIQGNLDPMVLLGDAETVRRHVGDVLRRAGDAPGHVFNLGHGIHKDTPPENVEVLVETVREVSRR